VDVLRRIAFAHGPGRSVCQRRVRNAMVLCHRMVSAGHADGRIRILEELFRGHQTVSIINSRPGTETGSKKNYFRFAKPLNYENMRTREQKPNRNLFLATINSYRVFIVYKSILYVFRFIELRYIANLNF